MTTEAEGEYAGARAAYRECHRFGLSSAKNLRSGDATRSAPP